MATAVILAGGKSSRLGRDKASLEIGGRSLLQRVIESVAELVEESVVVIHAGQELPVVVNAAFRRVEDVYPEKGPLGGLYSGLLAVRSFPALAVACDMPLLRPALLQELQLRALQCDAVVPLREGLPEPLCAAYGPNCLEAARLRLQGDELKLTGFLADVNVCYLPEAEWRLIDPEARSFVNINTNGDLRRAESLLTST